ncbi:MAG: hypothetical protein ACLFN8_02005 [Candidatus Woesearchaeota archaeon]
METHIIKYGGSFVISGEKYNQDALDELVKLAEENTEKQFVFIIGGGKLCRNINMHAKPLLEDALGDKSDEQLNIALDELGIAVTKINARYVRAYLEEKLTDKRVYEDIIDYPEVAVKTNKQVIIAAGYKPGVSTDYDMMLLAKAYSATTAIKISDFPIVLNVKPLDFDKTKIPEYTPMPKITWEQILDLVGREFIAGGNYPLDPPSAILGNNIIKEKPNFTLYIGQKEQLNKMLKGEDFYGTIIQNK